MAIGQAQFEARAARWRRTLGRVSHQRDHIRSRRDWLVDWALFASAAAFGGFTQAYLWADHGPVVDGLDVAFGTVACMALWARRSRPVGVFVAAGLAASFSPLALGAGLVAIFNVGLRVRGRVLLMSCVWMVAGSVAFPLVNPKAGEELKPVFPAFLLTVIAVGAGLFVRARRDLIVSLGERAEQLEADQQRSAEGAREGERRRIAREMHDVLAHRLSLLAIHAGALEFRLDASPGEIAQAAAVIRNSASTALDELSQVIAVLREETPGAAARPQPTLDDLPELFAESRAAGMLLNAHVDLLVVDSVSMVLERTAYRVAQEGLTNARKHAPGAEVDLIVSGDRNGGLVVEVVNHPTTDMSATQPPVTPGAGSGLIGLAERLALIGGKLEHGPNAAGDFVLRATVAGL